MRDTPEPTFRLFLHKKEVFPLPQKKGRHFFVTFPSLDILNPKVLSDIVFCLGTYSVKTPAAQLPATAAMAREVV